MANKNFWGVAFDIGSAVYDKLLISHRRTTELRKFKDNRRVSITKTVELSNEQKEEIDEFYIRNYGQKIPYTWHRHYTAFTGKFDVKYFPELLYIPEFEHFMNLWPFYNKAFADKNVLPIMADYVGVKTPRSLFYCVRGACRDEKGKPLSRQALINALKDSGPVFIKNTVDTSSGRGCSLAFFSGGIDSMSGTSVAEIVDNLGTDFSIQERVICHKSVKELYPRSVNTFRVMTYRWHDDIHICPVTMRIGSGGSYLDNVHSGGMCIAVNKDGTLHDTAFTEFNQQFKKHPDTQTVFQGHKIIGFDKMCGSALKIHELLPQLGVVHWDFTIDQEASPILIEANTFGTSVQLIQRPWGCGAFGQDTGDILQWMRKMKSLSPTKRYEYAFGK